MPLANLLSRKPGRPKTPDGPELAPPIAEKIAAVRQELESTAAEYSAAAMDLATDVEGAADRLAAVKARRADLLARIDDLEAGHAAALDSDRQMRAAQRAMMYRTQIGAVKRHLHERDEAAKRLQVALENAASAWRDTWLSARRAKAANPPGGVWPEASLCDTVALTKAVMHEAWRLRGKHPQLLDTDDSPASCPLGQPVNSVDLSPTRQPALLDQIARSTEYVMATLEGRKPK